MNFETRNTILGPIVIDILSKYVHNSTWSYFNGCERKNAYKKLESGLFEPYRFVWVSNEIEYLVKNQIL